LYEIYSAFSLLNSLHMECMNWRWFLDWRHNFVLCSSTLTGIHSFERHIEWFDDYKSVLRSEYT